MGTLLAIAGKDLRLLLRDKFGLFWIFAFPLLYAAFFGMIFGGSEDRGRGKLGIALVDEDRSDASQRLIAKLAAHESLSADRPEGDAKGVVVVALDAARDEVRRGRKVAYVRIPAGYGAEPFALFSGGDDAARLQVGVDPSRSAEAGFLQGVLMECMFGSMSELFTDKQTILGQVARGKDEVQKASDLSGAQKLVLATFMDAVTAFIGEADLSVLERGTAGIGGGQDLVEVVEVTRDRSNRPRSAFEITFPQAMVWGLMGVALGFAITLVRERTHGTLLRLRMAPVTRARLLAGKSLACFVTCMLAMLFLLVFGAVALGVRAASPLLLLVAMAATAVSFTGIMMTASVMGKTEQAVAGSAWGAMMPFAMIGGGMIPLIAMPPWLVEVSNFSPFKWAIYALEGAVWRGFALSDMVGPCAILVAVGVGFFVLGGWLYRRSYG
jgi:ABC-2 type transport system permease protein